MWRIVLSWMPRYIILLSIFVIYFVLWHHVRKIYKVLGTDLEDNVHGSMDEHSPGTQTTHRNGSQARHLTSVHHARLMAFHFHTNNIAHEKTDVEPDADDANQSQPGTPNLSSNSHLNDHSNTASSTYRDEATADERSRLSSIPNSEKDLVAIPNRRQTDSSVQQLQLRRAAVLRQMRNLFIFPVVYFLQWIIPFISHILQSASTDITLALYVFTIMSNVILPSQGFINVVVYAVREKPWRQANSRPLLPFSICSFSYFGHLCGNASRSERNTSSTFRSRLSFPHYAYARREMELQEATEARKEAAAVAVASPSSIRRPSTLINSTKEDSTGRQWWDSDEARLHTIVSSCTQSGNASLPSSPT